MTLIVGFDSAWTAGKQGGIVAVAAGDTGYLLVCPPTNVRFSDAAAMVKSWRREHSQILVMLDQPAIVANEQGSRPVEKIVSSLVSRAKGGMQPANRKRVGMFCAQAPIWGFLRDVGGSLEPLSTEDVRVIETYPVLAMLGLGWLQPSGSLLKYNPERRKTFRGDHWQQLCSLLGASYQHRGIDALADWCRIAAATGLQGSLASRKAIQDQLDALICLHAGLHWWEGGSTLQVGTTTDGLIVTPMREACRKAVDDRIARLGWLAADWLVDLTQRAKS